MEFDLYKYINSELLKRNIKKAELIQKTDLDYKSGYKYLTGERKLRRDSLIRICIIFELSIEEIEELFYKSFYPQLYKGSKRDSIIINGITKKQTISELNECLKKESLDLI